MDDVDAGKSQRHCSSLKYSLPQLRTMHPFIFLQKMSGHTLWSFCQFGDPAYWYSRGFLKNTYPFWLDRRGPFIVLGTPSSWRWENSLTFAVMMVLRGWQSHHYLASSCQRLLGGWLVVPLVFSLCRRCRVGRSRSSGKAWECPVEHAFGEMSHDCPRNTVSYLGQQLPGPD